MGIGVAVVGSSVYVASLAPIMMGFYTTGIAKGSIAAGIHSGIGYAAAGSLFSIA